MVFISLTFCYHFNYYTKELVFYFNNWQKNLSLIILGKDVTCRNLKISFSYMYTLLYFAHIPLCYLCCLPPCGPLSKESHFCFHVSYMDRYICVHICMHTYMCVQYVSPFNSLSLVPHSHYPPKPQILTFLFLCIF